MENHYFALISIFVDVRIQPAIEQFKFINNNNISGYWLLDIIDVFSILKKQNS